MTITLNHAAIVLAPYLTLSPMTSDETLDNFEPQFGPGYYTTQYSWCDDMTIFVYATDYGICLDAEYRDALLGVWSNDRTTVATEPDLVAAVTLLINDINITKTR